jgi:hypothetical protein
MSKVSMRWSLNFDGLTQALTHFLHTIQYTGLKNQLIKMEDFDEYILVNLKCRN